MIKFKDPTPNPTSINCGVKYSDSGGVLVKDGQNYGGLKITYDDRAPSSTTITLTALSGDKTATAIATTEIDGKTKNDAWTHNATENTFSYQLPSGVIDQSGHAINFTITWSDGTKHDPRIVINNGNPSP